MDIVPYYLLDLFQVNTSLSLITLEALASQLGLIIVLLFGSGLLSGSEVAYFSIDNNDLSELKDAEDDSSKRILNLLKAPKYLLSTILITNNLINIGIILVSDSLLEQLLPIELIEAILPLWLAGAVHFSITIILVTFLLVLFGEVTPKVYASSNNMRIAHLMSRALTGLKKFCYPISLLLVNSTEVIEHRLKKVLSSKTVSQKDIYDAIELIVKDDKYGDQDVDILKGIVRFGNILVKSIMQPRLNVVAVDEKLDFQELLEVIRESGYSRIPVYSGTIDKIRGVVHSKDLLNFLGEGKDFDWHSQMRSPLFVPEHRKIDDVFRDFQDQHTHMAIIFDEYGGTSGIVTMEDVLEEIVGDIQDEFDEADENAYNTIKEGVYEFEGQVFLADVAKIINQPITFFDKERETAETLAGLILVLEGKMPKQGTRLSFKSYTFTILSVSKRRIERIRIQKEDQIEE